jgi:hypothetical protein
LESAKPVIVTLKLAVQMTAGRNFIGEELRCCQLNGQFADYWEGRRAARFHFHVAHPEGFRESVQLCMGSLIPAAGEDPASQGEC